MLGHHPWFQVVAVAASEKSRGKKYREAVTWLMPTPIPSHIAEMEVLPCEPNLPCKLVFSALDSSVAGEIETAFAQAGYTVNSNSRNHRMDPDVPLLVPEVNPEHLQLVKTQKYGKGMIVTNPNCSTIGLVVALKPLLDKFGLEAVNVVTMQAVSGAGYPGVSSLDIMDNVVPYISGEEEKMETEPLKILGTLASHSIAPLDLKISAQCNRVPVSDGHLECVSVKLKRKASKEELISAWREFSGEAQRLKLPTAPERPIYYFDEQNYPQSKRHRDLDKGMAVSIGRLRDCPLFDYKFVILSHNTVRGAAGGALLIAELMLRYGLIYW
jgi:aspartate-semialdehyde dehydrogenase